MFANHATNQDGRAALPITTRMYTRPHWYFGLAWAAACYLGVMGEQYPMAALAGLVCVGHFTSEIVAAVDDLRKAVLAKGEEK